ncbi:MAG: hypothetical protein RMJ54_00495, partial [Roseiflexaceae bacterium]|nr:hypothetical protein [Roseiflexaceae bacterium]
IARVADPARDLFAVQAGNETTDRSLTHGAPTVAAARGDGQQLAQLTGAALFGRSPGSVQPQAKIASPPPGGTKSVWAGRVTALSAASR